MNLEQSIHVMVMAPFLNELELKYVGGSPSLSHVRFSSSRTALDLNASLVPSGLAQLSISSFPAAPLLDTKSATSSRKADSSTDLLPMSLSFTVIFPLVVNVLSRHSIILLRPCADRCTQCC